MEAEMLIPLVTAVLGTAGLAGIAKYLSGLRRPVRMRAKIEADLSLAKLFDDDDAAHVALVHSARVTAVDLAVLTLVRGGSYAQLLRQTGGAAFVVGLVGTIGFFFESWRESGSGLVAYFLSPESAPSSVLSWINFAMVFFGFVLMSTGPRMLWMYRPLGTSALMVASAESFSILSFPVEIDPGKTGKRGREAFVNAVLRVQDEAATGSPSGRSGAHPVPA